MNVTVIMEDEETITSFSTECADSLLTEVACSRESVLCALTRAVRACDFVLDKEEQLVLYNRETKEVRY